ncbi:MAG: O-antigen ligase family protein [Anaerolineales bacterium]
MTEAHVPRRRLSTLQPSLLLLGSVLLLLMLGVSLDSLSPSVKLGGVSVGALMALTWWIFHRRETSIAFEVSGTIMKPLLALVLLQTILVFRAPMLRPSFEAEIQTLTLFLFFLFVLGSLNARWTPRIWEDALILIVVALSAVESILIGAWFRQWWEISGGQPLVPPTGYRASGLLLGHPNVLAGFIGLVLPLLLVRILSARTTSTRMKRSLPFGFLLLILFFTSSRGGWLASALGLAVAVGLTFLDRFKGIADAFSGAGNWLRSRPWWQLALGTIAAVGIAYIAFWQIARTGHAPLTRSRLPVWRVAWDIFQSSRLLGHGPGSFPFLFALISPFRELDVPHAHNLLLQFLDESGLIGLIILSGLIASIGRMMIRGWIGANGPSRKMLAGYAGAGAAMLSHNMIDFLFGQPLYTAAAFVLLALGLDAVKLPSQNGNDAPMKIGPIVLLSLTLPLALTICLRGAWTYWDGINLARSGDWHAAADTLCEFEPNRTEPLDAEACGLATAVMKGSEYDIATGNALFEAANGDPYWGFHFANLSLVQWITDQQDEAIVSMQRAITDMPSEPTLAIMRGFYAESHGDFLLASAYYSEALREEPWMLWDDFFQRSPRRVPESTEGITSEFTEANLLLWRATLDLRTDNPEQAMALVSDAEHLSPRNSMIYALRAENYALHNQLDEAQRAVEIGRFIQPNDLLLQVLEARIAAQREDLDGARTALTQAANNVRYDTRSQRYYYAAYNRYSLPIDRLPAAFRAAPVPGLLDDLIRAIHDPEWTSGAQPSQVEAWTEAAGILSQWR